MSVYIIVPARYKSKRLPNKMLLLKEDKTLIEHTVENCRKSKLADEVFVVTDNTKISHLFDNNIMVSPECSNGTIRVYWAAKKLKLDKGDIVINIQGDWPNISPVGIDDMIYTLKEGKFPSTSLYYHAPKTIASSLNKVKVVTNTDEVAIYFSRSMIPYNVEEYKIHIGAYGFKKWVLDDYRELSDTPEGKAEDLEQLRLIQNNFPMKMIETTPCYSVDSKADYMHWKT